jgi:hypothetical protein
MRKIATIAKIAGNAKIEINCRLGPAALRSPSNQDLLLRSAVRIALVSSAKIVCDPRSSALIRGKLFFARRKINGKDRL